MGTKMVRYNQTNIAELPNDKSALYRIETATGRPNYVGVAARGRVRERLSEHLGEIPGVTLKIEQFANIRDARKKEANVIKRSQPKHNQQGK